jgi:hypothetical protein
MFFARKIQSGGETWERTVLTVFRNLLQNFWNRVQTQVSNVSEQNWLNVAREQCFWTVSVNNAAKHSLSRPEIFKEIFSLSNILLDT